MKSRVHLTCTPGSVGGLGGRPPRSTRPLDDWRGRSSGRRGFSCSSVLSGTVADLARACSGRSTLAHELAFFLTRGCPSRRSPPGKRRIRDGSSGGSIHRSSPGNGTRRTAPGAATGIARGAGQGLPLARIPEVVCALYEIEPTELRHRGSRHLARAALAADSGDQCGAGGNARGVACGERPQPGSALQCLITHRCERPPAVEMPR